MAQGQGGGGGTRENVRPVRSVKNKEHRCNGPRVYPVSVRVHVLRVRACVGHRDGPKVYPVSLLQDAGMYLISLYLVSRLEDAVVCRVAAQVPVVG